MESFDFELLASALRADTRDLGTFVEVLASKLEGALPGRTEVERRGGGLLSRQRKVRRLTVSLGDVRYVLSNEGGNVQTACAKVVRGIVLKSEPVPLDEWIDGLSRDLAEEARGSEQARLALERLLHG